MPKIIPLRSEHRYTTLYMECVPHTKLSQWVCAHITDSTMCIMSGVWPYTTDFTVGQPAALIVSIHSQSTPLISVDTGHFISYTDHLISLTVCCCYISFILPCFMLFPICVRMLHLISLTACCCYISFIPPYLILLSIYHLCGNVIPYILDCVLLLH